MSAVASLTAPAAVTAGKAAAFSRGASRVAQVRAPRFPERSASAIDPSSGHVVRVTLFPRDRFPVR